MIGFVLLYIINFYNMSDYRACHVGYDLVQVGLPHALQPPFYSQQGLYEYAQMHGKLFM